MKVKEYDEENSITFEVLLQEAEAFAISDWEMHFISDIRENYTVYKGDMFISEKQLKQIERIANL